MFCWILILIITWKLSILQIPYICFDMMHFLRTAAVQHIEMQYIHKRAGLLAITLWVVSGSYRPNAAYCKSQSYEFNTIALVQALDASPLVHTVVDYWVYQLSPDCMYLSSG